MKSNMKKLIAILLLVPAITAQAQDNWKPNKQDLDRAGSAGHFAETLIKAAISRMRKHGSVTSPSMGRSSPSTRKTPCLSVPASRQS
jgi:hypothetical protein